MPSERSVCKGEILVCRRCGGEFRRRHVPVHFLNEAREDVDRLRDLIGHLYVARGGTRHELYNAIRAAFRDSRPGGRINA